MPLGSLLQWSEFNLYSTFCTVEKQPYATGIEIVGTAVICVSSEMHKVVNHRCNHLCIDNMSAIFKQSLCVSPTMSNYRHFVLVTWPRPAGCGCGLLYVSTGESWNLILGSKDPGTVKLCEQPSWSGKEVHSWTCYVTLHCSINARGSHKLSKLRSNSPNCKLTVHQCSFKMPRWCLSISAWQKIESRNDQAPYIKPLLSPFNFLLIEVKTESSSNGLSTE